MKKKPKKRAPRKPTPPHVPKLFGLYFENEFRWDDTYTWVMAPSGPIAGYTDAGLAKRVADVLEAQDGNKYYVAPIN